MNRVGKEGREYEPGGVEPTRRTSQMGKRYGEDDSAGLEGQGGRAGWDDKVARMNRKQQFLPVKDRNGPG